MRAFLILLWTLLRGVSYVMYSSEYPDVGGSAPFQTFREQLWDRME